jgi:hypothetical protein
MGAGKYVFADARSEQTPIADVVLLASATNVDLSQLFVLEPYVKILDAADRKSLINGIA